MKKSLKNITDYFSRTIKTEDYSVEKQNDEPTYAILLGSCKEENDSDECDLYSSEDEVNKKPRLLVQVPGMAESMGKTKKHNREFSPSSGKKIRIRPYGVDKYFNNAGKKSNTPEFNVTMSPLILESDCSRDGTPEKGCEMKFSTPLSSLTDTNADYLGNSNSIKSFDNFQMAIKSEKVETNGNESESSIIKNENAVCDGILNHEETRRINSEVSVDLETTSKDSQHELLLKCEERNRFRSRSSIKNSKKHKTIFLTSRRSLDFSGDVKVPDNKDIIERKEDKLRESSNGIDALKENVLENEHFSQEIAASISNDNESVSVILEDSLIESQDERNKTVRMKNSDSYHSNMKRKKSSADIRKDVENGTGDVKKMKTNLFVKEMEVNDSQSNLYNYFSKTVCQKQKISYKDLAKSEKLKSEEVSSLDQIVDEQICTSPTRFNEKLTQIDLSDDVPSETQTTSYSPSCTKKKELSALLSDDFVKHSIVEQDQYKKACLRRNTLRLTRSTIRSLSQPVTENIEEIVNLNEKEKNKNNSNKTIGSEKIMLETPSKISNSKSSTQSLVIEQDLDIEKKEASCTKNSSSEDFEEPSKNRTNRPRKLVKPKVSSEGQRGSAESRYSLRLKKSSETSKRAIPQRSANQRKAAELVSRACRTATLRCRKQNSNKENQLSITYSDDVIILNDTNGDGGTKNIIIKPAFVKLAPLFLAKDELRRKQVFLQSGTPEVLQKRIQQQKQIETELEEKSVFPKVSHILQRDQEVFPWNLEKEHTLKLRCESSIKEEMLISDKKFYLGSISNLSTPLAYLLLSMKPPINEEENTRGSFSTKDACDDEYVPCFCAEMPCDLPKNLREPTAKDIEKFERVHAWLVRSLLPPGVAYKMHVDLSSFLPVPSPEGFVFDHISVLPIKDSSRQQLQHQMLLKLKEEYPGIPIYRWFKCIYQKRRSFGGLYFTGISDVDKSVEIKTMKLRPRQASSPRCDSSNRRLSSTKRSRGKSSAGDKNPAHEAEHSEDSNSSKSIFDESSNLSLCSLSSSQPVDEPVIDVYSDVMFSSEMWSKIFKPQTFSDACRLGRNTKTIEKLRSWLESWMNRSQNAKKKKGKRRRKNSDPDYSSGDDFVSSDDENIRPGNTGNSPSNVAILIGPCGSGKTSIVYAIAKELGCKVFEINASSKRAGRNILDAVKEATSSHQVTQSGHTSLGSFFQNSAKNAPSPAVASKKKRTREENNSQEMVPSAMSIIFVEDVDLVFENKDEGFIAALTSLTMSSKRPFILEVHTSEPLKLGTTNEAMLLEKLMKTCPHLNNLLAKQSRSPLLLPFERFPNNCNAEALLRVICLSEGIWVSKLWSEGIVKNAGGDFRKAIQQAHFWAGSISRANILHASSKRYPKEAIQEDSAKFDDACVEKRVNPTQCGCKRVVGCSYPYSWMHKDYLKHIWLNFDQIINDGIAIIQKEVMKQDSFTETRPPKTKQEVKPPFSSISVFSKSMARIHSPLKWNLRDRSSPQVLRSPLRSKKIRICSRNMDMVSPNQCKQLNPYHERIIRSCPPKFKLKNDDKSGNLVKRKLNLGDAHEHEEYRKKEIKTERMSSESENQMREHLLKKAEQKDQLRNINFCSDVLDLLRVSDILTNSSRKVKRQDLGNEVVFEIGNLSNLVPLAMQAAPSQKCRELESKLIKSASTTSQCEIILPFMPSQWILNKKSLALDVVPHIRDSCRHQAQLIKRGEGRTRNSDGPPTLRRFGPVLREVMCNTFNDDGTSSYECNQIDGNNS